LLRSVPPTTNAFNDEQQHQGSGKGSGKGEGGGKGESGGKGEDGDKQQREELKLHEVQKESEFPSHLLAKRSQFSA
jgi:ribosomal protein L15